MNKRESLNWKISQIFINHTRNETILKYIKHEKNNKKIYIKN